MHSIFTNSLIHKTLTLFLLLIFIASVIFQLYFIIFVFAKIICYHSPKITSEKNQGVSVIVCAWNELENLRVLIPLLNNQKYSIFEIIIINDRSCDGTHDFLSLECTQYKKVRFIKIDKTPEHLSSKKYALTLGIKSANYENILLTDADCRPQSNHWISGMAECMTGDKQIVLGFSPYFKEKGFLNHLIRYETFITATQYLSFAIKGIPYMGVGRNLMYKKSLFLNNEGLAKHINVLGGDDDLFMNDVANDKNTTICLNSQTFVYSFPKTTWKTWYIQKQRHLSVGKYYKLRNKVLLGGLVFSQITTSILFIILVLLMSNKLLISVLVGTFLLRIICQWIVFYKVNKRLDNTLDNIILSPWDIIFTLYFFIMGINSFFLKKQKLKWR